jgi:outer membrane protein TolC
VHARVGVARGRFEPLLTANLGYSNADTPPPVTLLQQGLVTSLVNVETYSWSAGVSAELPTGTRLSAGWTNVRTQSTSGGTALTDPLLYNSGLLLSVTQPLLRGFAFDLDIPQADLLRARFASQRAALDVRASLIATLKATEDAWWELVRAFKEREVRRTSVELARRQLQLTNKQIELGILARSDSIAPDFTLAQRELALVEADAAIARAADLLRQVLNLPRSEWSRPLVPPVPATLDDPPRDSHPNLDEAMALAFKNRPELAQRRIDIERTNLDVRAARANRLPTLDVGLSYQMIGQQSSYQATLEQMASSNVKAWTASASFSWSPLMTAARAQVDSSLAAQRAAEVQLEQQRLDLLAELRNDLQEIETAAREIRAAAHSRELATRALDVEQYKFQDGTSTNFIIGQRQAELEQTRLEELRAVIRHRKARTALEAAMGTLIEARGIKLDVGQGGPHE